MLVAGIGNIFRGDDAFGSEVARRLAARTLPQGVGVRDFGNRAIDLAYALVRETGEAILIDAVSRGGAPLGGPMNPARSIASPYSARSAALISSGRTDGPGSDSSGRPAERSLASKDRAPSV
jgi:hypothetical protein